MRISTPTERGETIDKDVVVGGSIRFRLNGYRYLLEGTVTEIDEESAWVRVNTANGIIEVPQNAIRDALTTQQAELANFLNQDVQQRR